MNAASEAADLVADAIPAARSRRWLAYLIAGLIAAALVALLWWWFFVRPAHQAQQAAQSKVDATMGNAAADIATKAIPTINDATRQKVEVDVQVQKGQIDVRAAPDARVQVSGVSAAVRRNACMLEIYAADPTCVAMHEDTAGVGAAGRHEAGPSPR